MYTQTNISLHPIKQVFNGILDLIYPPLCLVCGQKLTDREEQLCLACLERFSLLGKPHSEFSIPGKVFISTAWALFEFDPQFQSLIHHLKYSRRRKPIIRVLNHYDTEIMDLLPGKTYDWIIPIPLHPRKQRERGYNQVDGVSLWLGDRLGAKVGDHLVLRRKYTRSQTKLNAEERHANVARAFAVKLDSEINGKKLLLVDDVLTTGATANALAKVLVAAGAQRVDLLTLSTPG